MEASWTHAGPRGPGYARRVDRQRLQKWLDAPRRTFRWNDGRPSEYHAVELTGGALVWYRWAHDEGGRVDEATQSLEDFVASGPLRDAPAGIVSELSALVLRLARDDR